MTIDEIMDAAMKAHQAGRLPEAESLYRQALAQQPNYAEALHLLGILAHQAGQSQAGADLIRRALALQPSSAEYQNNLGVILLAQKHYAQAAAAFEAALKRHGNGAAVRHNLGLAQKGMGLLKEAEDSQRAALSLKPDHAGALGELGALLHATGRFDEALPFLRRAVVVQPNFPEAHTHLGNTLYMLGHPSGAEDAYRTALKHRPDCVEAMSNLVLLLKGSDRTDEAVEMGQQAVVIRPDFASAWNNLGIALHTQGRTGEAIEAYQRALLIQPDDPDTRMNLGNSLKDAGRYDEAVTAHERAAALSPQSAEAIYNLAVSLEATDRLDDAVDALHRAVKLRPDFAEAWNNLGKMLKDQALLDESISAYRAALAIRPDFAVARNNLCFMLHFHYADDPAAIKRELDAFNQQHAQPLKNQIHPHSNDRSPQRRLRVGYVSGDFREHAVQVYTVPLLSNHNHENFEIFCYAHVAREDHITRMLRPHADVWHDVHKLSDACLAELIDSDRIDVLVDLSMHTAGNRLLAFARKPAPVQISWLGYPGSTGLTAIDYRITDPWLDPPGVNDEFYSEQSIRLPYCFWCYDPLTSEPAVGELPLLRNGYITFGCLNHFGKTNERTLALWARVLREAKGSRMLISAFEGRSRGRTLETLEKHGVDPSRIDFVGRVPRAEYLARFGQFDLALDTFPYNGHTTSLDGLWMGVPVVSRAGRTAVSRGGLTLLSNLGLSELAATTDDQFVRAAVNLASDRDRLASLRATLRRRMEQSPLMDAPGFVRDMENIYRAAWIRWCQEQS